MKATIILAASLLALPLGASAATRSYDTREFSAIAVAAGITVDVNLGGGHRVVAETRADQFDDLRIRVEGDVLHIDRPRRSWLLGFWRRADYRVRVDAPTLRRLSASSGARVSVQGESPGNELSVSASSGSSLDIRLARSNAITAHTSSGSRLRLSGSCQSIRIEASSGANLDAAELRCNEVSVRASSGSSVSLAASRRVDGAASSGSAVTVRGRAVVEVKQSSGADVVIRN